MIVDITMIATDASLKITRKFILGNLKDARLNESWNKDCLLLVITNKI